MPQFWDSIPQNIHDWALAQPLFYTASAPLAGKHVNISPKGLPSSTFTIFDPNHAAYIDATGSGGETISHVYENGRVTIMFCSFDVSPRIVRFFCKGRVVESDTPEYDGLLRRMGKEQVEGARAVILLDVFKIQQACGYGVPVHKKEDAEDAGTMSPSFDDRKTLTHWATNQVEQSKMKAYRVKWNAQSLDGLPGLKSARRDKGEWLLLRDLSVRARRIWAQREALTAGVLLGLLVAVLWRMAGLEG